MDPDFHFLLFQVLFFFACFFLEMILHGRRRLRISRSSAVDTWWLANQFQDWFLVASLLQRVVISAVGVLWSQLPPLIKTTSRSVRGGRHRTDVSRSQSRNACEVGSCWRLTQATKKNVGIFFTTQLLQAACLFSDRIHSFFYLFLLIRFFFGKKVKMNASNLGLEPRTIFWET